MPPPPPSSPCDTAEIFYLCISPSACKPMGLYKGLIAKVAMIILTPTVKTVSLAQAQKTLCWKMLVCGTTQHVLQTSLLWQDRLLLFALHCIHVLIIMLNVPGYLKYQYLQW